MNRLSLSLCVLVHLFYSACDARDSTDFADAAESRQASVLAGDVSPTTGTADPSTTWSTLPDGWISFQGGWTVPLLVQPGDIVPPISVNIGDATGGAVTAMLVAQAGGTAAVLGSAVSDGSGQRKIYNLSNAARGVRNNESLAVRFLTYAPVPLGPAEVGAVHMGSTIILGSLTTINVPLASSPVATLSPANGYMPPSFPASTTGDGSNGAFFNVSGIPVGSTIVAVRAKVSDTLGHPVIMSLISKEMPGNTAPAWGARATATSAGSGSIQALSTTTPYTVPPFTQLGLVFGGISVNPLRAYVAEIDYQ